MLSTVPVDNSVGELAHVRLGVAAMEVVPPELSWLAVVARPAPSNSESWMDSHENARTTARGRLLMIERLQAGWSIATVAAAFGVCPATVRKWRNRFAAEGTEGLRDRSSRPLHCPNRLALEAAAAVEAVHRQRLSGPAIARRL
jgi:transposase-like protein